MLRRTFALSLPAIGAALAACAGMPAGSPNQYGTVKLMADTFAGVARTFLSMFNRGALSKGRAQWVSAKLEQPLALLEIGRTDNLRGILEDLERELREREAQAKIAEREARSRGASTRGLLDLITAINSGIVLIEEVRKLNDSWQGAPSATEEQMKAAVADLRSAKVALDAAIAARP